MYKGRRRCTGQVTAMKFIMKAGKSEKDLRNLRQEIEVGGSSSSSSSVCVCACVRACVCVCVCVCEGC